VVAQLDVADDLGGLVHIDARAEFRGDAFEGAKHAVDLENRESNRAFAEPPRQAPKRRAEANVL
jgi:hypothetical protein